MVVRISRMFLLSLLCAVAGALAVEGRSVFHIGNSLTDETYGVHDVAHGFGYTGIDFGRFMIPGAPIRWLYSHDGPNDGFKNIYLNDKSNVFWYKDSTTPQILRLMNWNTLVMQVFEDNGDGPDNSETIMAARAFARAAWEGNANCNVYILVSHTMVVGKRDPATTMTRCYEPIADSVERTSAGKKCYLIPTINAWNSMLDQGVSDLWVPGDGHASAKGKYLNYMLMFACVYRQDPHGAITTWTADNGTFSVTADYARKAQDVAWDVARAYPRSGVTSTATVAPASPRTSAMRGSRAALTVDITGRKQVGVKSATASVTVDEKTHSVHMTGIK